MTHLTQHASRLTFYILLLASCILLPACAQPTQPTTQSIPAYGSIHQDLPTDTSPTVENPLLYLDITITDAQTGQPIAADVTIDSGPTSDPYTEHAVTGLQAIIAANHPHTVTVTAPGYQLWSSMINTNLHHDKHLKMPIKLEPLKDTG